MDSSSPPSDIISDDEKLVRYIFFRRHIRADRTIKPDAFIPHPHPDLSVTRQLGLTDIQVWAYGDLVSEQRQRSLIGRADNQAANYRARKLSVHAAPVEGNLNHANIDGWPDDKPSQKMIAQEIAASSDFLPKPIQS